MPEPNRGWTVVSTKTTSLAEEGHVHADEKASFDGQGRFGVAVQEYDVQARADNSEDNEEIADGGLMGFICGL